MENNRACGSLAVYLLERKGYEITDADREIFRGCHTPRDVVNRLATSGIIRMLFLNGTSSGLSNLGEFYISLLSEAVWEPSVGYDAYGAFKYLDAIKSGKIEVKTSGPTNRPKWDVRITGQTTEIRSDVTVFLGMKENLNPTTGRMFLFPRDVLEPIAAEHREKRKRNSNLDPRAKIYVPTDPRRITRKLDCYRYLLPEHERLKNHISQYIHGDYGIGPYQLSLI